MVLSVCDYEFGGALTLTGAQSRHNAGSKGPRQHTPKAVPDMVPDYPAVSLDHPDVASLPMTDPPPLTYHGPKSKTYRGCNGQHVGSVLHMAAVEIRTDAAALQGGMPARAGRWRRSGGTGL